MNFLNLKNSKNRSERKRKKQTSHDEQLCSRSGDQKSILWSQLINKRKMYSKHTKCWLIENEITFEFFVCCLKFMTMIRLFARSENLLKPLNIAEEFHAVSKHNKFMQISGWRSNKFQLIKFNEIIIHILFSDGESEIKHGNRYGWLKGQGVSHCSPNFVSLNSHF